MHTFPFKACSEVHSTRTLETIELGVDVWHDFGVRQLLCITRRPIYFASIITPFYPHSCRKYQPPPFPQSNSWAVRFIWRTPTPFRYNVPLGCVVPNISYIVRNVRSSVHNILLCTEYCREICRKAKCTAQYLVLISPSISQQPLQLAPCLLFPIPFMQTLRRVQRITSIITSVHDILHIYKTYSIV